MQKTRTAHTEEPAGLHAEILPKLRRMILEGELQPGARIVERLICERLKSERLKVSRTPLREAFKVLATEGLIELLPNRGARVPTLCEEDICATFEVLSSLEALAGELAAKRASNDTIAEIRAMHYQMYAHFLRRELPEYFRINQAIHRRIVEAAENPVLSAHYEILDRRVLRARYFANRWDDERWAHAMSEHDAILDALMNRIGAQLAERLRQHLMNKLASLLEHFRNSSETSPQHKAGKPKNSRSVAAAAQRSKQAAAKTGAAVKKHLSASAAAHAD